MQDGTRKRWILDTFGPVTGTSPGVGHGDDLDFAGKLAEDHQIGVGIQDCAARAA